jgi:hypothetical protein
MIDDVERAQDREADAREAGIARTVALARLADRICVRCGNSLPRSIREAHPDWTDCNGLCAFR